MQETKPIIYRKQFAAKVEQGFEYFPDSKKWLYWVTVLNKGRKHIAAEEFYARQKKTSPIYARLEKKAMEQSKRRIKFNIMRRANNAT